MVTARFKYSMKNIKARPSTIIALALTSWATAMAQFAPDPTLALDEITVTATRIAQPVSDVPASISIIRLNDLLNPVASLSDLARSEPGVSAPASFGATGNAPRNFPTTRSFNIRGIDGNRVLIQVDGVRQPEQFTFGNAQLIGRDYFEPSLYRTAEILKGSASALYGSDAVGGVLSFLSPAPGALLADAKRDVLAGTSVTYASANDEWTGTASAAGRKGKFAAVATATRREGHETEPNGSYPADPSEFTVDAALFRADYTPSAGSTLFLTGETFTKTTEASSPASSRAPSPARPAANASPATAPASATISRVAAVISATSRRASPGKTPKSARATSPVSPSPPERRRRPRRCLSHASGCVTPISATAAGPVPSKSRARPRSPAAPTAFSGASTAP